VLVFQVGERALTVPVGIVCKNELRLGDQTEDRERQREREKK
jgi:hypothetical protein